MEKVWFKNYQVGVPKEINPDKYASLTEMLEKSCKKYSDLKAFANMGHTITYKALEEKSENFAAFLQNELHMEKGDRIAIMMPNLLQYPIAMFAALKAGLIVVNVNPMYTPRELRHQLMDSECKTVVVLENFANTVEQVLPDTVIRHVIITKIGDLFPAPKSWIINFIVKYIKKMVPRWFIKETYSFNKALKKGKHVKFKKPKIFSNDVAFLQYTGATTGIAKGVMLTHRNMVANVEQGRAWIQPVLRDAKEIVITALPLYHIFSLTANCLIFIAKGGLNVLITNPRDIKSFIKELKRYPFTAISGVNTLFNALLNQEAFKTLDFSQLHIALGGGMAIQESVAKRWQKITGIPLIEAYGLTEASPAVAINPLNIHSFNGSVGLPISSTDVMVCDEDGKELERGQPGELCVRGPQVMAGYWNRREETEEALRDGWLHSGDIAIIDDQGFVKIVDRKKDVIFISGFNVYPTEVEDVIALMKEVREVAVIGIKQDIGETVKAFIVKNNDTLTKEDVIKHCRQQLTPYKVPKEIEFRQELPKSNVGKILKKALRSTEDA